MDSTATLKQEIKQLMVENLMLQVTADEIGDEQPLFGPGSLGLDSVDALQLVVALDKNYGLKIANPDAPARFSRASLPSRRPSPTPRLPVCANAALTQPGLAAGKLSPWDRGSKSVWSVTLGGPLLTP